MGQNGQIQGQNRNRERGNEGDCGGEEQHRGVLVRHQSWALEQLLLLIMMMVDRSYL